MRLVKSLHAGVIHRTYEMLGQRMFSLGSLWGYELSTGKPMREQDVWRIIGARLPEGSVFDAGYAKVCSEYLVAGSFLSAQPVGGAVVTARLGDREKSLSIFGNRYWSRTSFDGPEQITELPLTFEHAFGGKGFDKNPLGKGMVEVEFEGIKRLPLPNIEYSHRLMTSSKDRPEPASLGPLEVGWPQRQALSGTYDQRYIEDYMPGFPPDLDPLFFNSAAQDQWFDGYLNGTESFSFSGLNLDFPELNGVLPGIRARIFVEVEQEGVDRFVELDNQLDTAWFFPNDNLGVVIHRGSFPVNSTNASEVTAVLLAHEYQDDPERSHEHYQDQFYKRSDPEHGFKYMLNTRDLIPSGVTCGFDEIVQQGEKGPDPARVKMANYIDQQLEKGKAIVDDNLKDSHEGLEVAGIKERSVDEMMKIKSDPTPEQVQLEAIVEKIVPGYSDPSQAVDLTNMDLKALDELDEFIKQLSADKLAEADESLRKQIVQLREDGQAESAQVIEDALALRELPPILPRPASEVEQAIKSMQQQKGQLQREMHVLDSMGIDTRHLVESLSGLEKMEADLNSSKAQMVAVYRLGAHNIAEARSPHDGEEEALAAAFRAKLAQGQDLEEWDLAFTKLDKLEVASLSLRGCYLEHASLVGAQITDVNFSEVILANANLSGTHFSQVSFKAANLGGGILKKARFEDCDFTEATLGKARLSGAVFERCRFGDRIDAFLETDFSGATFIDCEISQGVFYQLAMSHCRFEKVQLDKASFVECALEAASFSESSLSGTNFITCAMNKVSFNECAMHNSRFVSGCQLEQSDFKRSQLTLSNFRENQMSGADFTHADVSSSDFSGATLVGACFFETLARRTLYIEANLERANMKRVDAMEASFQDARLTGTLFREASLYGANLYGVIVGDTDFASANLKKTLFKDWRPQRD